MQTKKLASALAFTAVAVNMVASVALAQVNDQVQGTQDLACDPVSRNFEVESALQPDNFQVGDDGTRPVSSSNDTSYVEATNSAYFDETVGGVASGVFDDTVDALRISSNTPYSCADALRRVQLVVSATNFLDGSNGLLTYGSDDAAGGTVNTSAEDYYAMLSVITSGVMACTSPCVLAGAAAETNNAIKHGEQNFFAAVGPNAKTEATPFDTDSILIRNDGTLNPVTLYIAPTGFEGSVDVPGLDYNLAMPANPEFPGSFTSNVTYTLS